MKRLLSAFLGVLFLATTAVADLNSYPYPFTGRWEPSSNPLLINDFGFQDIQNLRKDGSGLRGVSGHSRTTNGIVNATYGYIRNAFQFIKGQPAKTHILVQSFEAIDDTAGAVYDNTTAIPDVGDYSGIALHTDATGAKLGRFSAAPQGHVLYCNGIESQIWGGDEYRATSIIFSDQSAGNNITNGRDVTSALTNATNDSLNRASLTATYNYFIIGATRPLKGMKIYVSTANETASELTGKEWDGDTWNALTLTDNTDTGATLAQTGVVLWTSTVDTSKPKFLEGLALYWYEFTISAGSATIYQITLDAGFQGIKNIWSGEEQVISACKVFNGTTYLDYTDEVNDDTTSYVAILDALDTTHYLLLGFVNRMQGFNIKIPGGKENETVSVATVKHWDGDSWGAVDGQYDGTAVGGATFARSGVITFASTTLDYTKQNGDELPLHYYQITVSVQLGAEVEIYYITGIPATDEISGYKFPGLFQGRSWLFSCEGGHKNKAIYSVYNAPDLWNGLDSGALFFGGEEELTAACTIYNVFRTTGYEQLIVTKANETYRVFGESPSIWEVQQMSGNVGCIAPLSMVVCEIADISEDIKRHVAIWQSNSGVVMCDGATIVPISEDIRVYWDQNSSLYIPLDRHDDSQACYDPNTNSYILLISSGAGQATHNIELQYSLKYKEWTKVYIENSTGANPYQVIFPVRDTVGNVFIYGTTDEGHTYRTEHGTTWNGTAIEQYVWTKDLLLDTEQPLFRKTIIEYMRLVFETKDGADMTYLESDTGYLLTEAGDKIVLTYGESISFAYYGDQTLVVHGENNQYVPMSIDLDDGPYETQDCYLGPNLIHSFKISGDFTTLSDGMELAGFGLWYTPVRTVE
ncbi:hypothetical protein ES708_04638 [subsurface metagenome]